MTLLTTEHLSRSYGARLVVDDVSLRVEPGEIVGLLGPNGAGKTTTFRLVLGLLRPDSGTVSFRDRDVSGLPVHKRARLGMGYLAQEPSVFRGMTVEENILAVLEWIPGLTRADQRDRSNALIDRFHLAGLRRQKASQLSGGEQRRLEIARVLAAKPSLILLDEPFTNVDPITVEEIQSILNELRDQRLAILLTDHNVRETLSITDRSYILVGGRVFRHGTARSLVADEKVRKAYLGERFTLPDSHAEAATSPPPPRAGEPVSPANRQEPSPFGYTGDSDPADEG